MFLERSNLAVADKPSKTDYGLRAAQYELSWHWIFVLTGLIGATWGTVWYLVYRNPMESRWANAEEIEYIREGGGLVDLGSSHVKARKRPSWADFSVVLTRRKLWGIYLGQFCLTSTLWFFLTWFPTYLVKYRHMDYIKSGFLVSLPFLAALVGVL